MAKTSTPVFSSLLIEPNTDYAYMLIFGAWGSGKTHFWKHVVVPRLKKPRIKRKGRRS